MENYLSECCYAQPALEMDMSTVMVALQVSVVDAMITVSFLSLVLNMKL